MSEPTPIPVPPKPPSIIGVVLRSALTGGAGMLVLAVIFWFVELRTKPTPTPPAPAISLPATVTAHVGRICTIEAATAGKLVKWLVVSGPDKPDLMQHDPTSVHFVTPTPGDYRLQAFTVVAGAPEVAETHVLVDVGPTPPGPGPVPPAPPKPPDPPAPIPGDGLRVLIVYDAKTIDKMPPAQWDTLNSETVRSWLSAHTARGPDGKSSEWRVLDKTADMTAESKLWQDAMRRERKSLPWLIISNGKTGFEGPLPATANDAMQLLQKFGGS